jgi:hypothetical protein
MKFHVSALSFITFLVSICYLIRFFNSGNAASDRYYRSSLIIAEIRSSLSIGLHYIETAVESKISHTLSYLSEKSPFFESSSTGGFNDHSNDRHSDKKGYDHRHLVSHEDILSLGLDTSIFNVVKKKKKSKANGTANMILNDTKIELKTGDTAKVAKIDTKSNNSSTDTTLKSNAKKGSVTNNKNSKISEAFIMGVDENNLPVKIYEINHQELKKNTEETGNKSVINDIKINNISPVINNTVIEKQLVVDLNVRNFNLSDNNNGSKKSDGKLFYMYDLEEKYWWRWPDQGADCTQSGYMSQVIDVS